MSGDQTPTLLLGTLGLLSTVGVALFTQIYQGRRETQRAEQSARERHAERLYDARLDAYRRFLALTHRLREVQSGHKPLTPERRKEIRAAVFEQSRAQSELKLLAPGTVIEAARKYDIAAAGWSRAWEAWLALDDEDPAKVEARKRNGAASEAEYQALIALERAIRDDLGVEVALRTPRPQ